MRSQTTRTIAGHVNADGSIATGSDFTCQRISAGNYMLTFPVAFRLRALAATAAGVSATASLVSTAGASPYQVRTTSPPGTQADLPFDFVAGGAGA